MYLIISIIFSAIRNQKLREETETFNRPAMSKAKLSIRNQKLREETETQLADFHRAHQPNQKLETPRGDGNNLNICFHNLHLCIRNQKLREETETKTTKFQIQFLKIRNQKLREETETSCHLPTIICRLNQKLETPRGDGMLFYKKLIV